jgi:hypothetical protein
MSKDSDIERFAKDPSLLVELCREVIDKIDAGSDDARVEEKETQLREISRTIERLDKTGVAVPDVLRAEKTRLAADLGIKAEAAQALSRLAEEFEEMLKDLKARLGRAASPTVNNKKKPRPRSRSPRTDMKIFKEHIIFALLKFGGRAKATEIIEEVGKELKDKFLPGDLEWNERNKLFAWQHKTQWARFQLTQDGTMRSDSRRGYWELNLDRF